MSNMWKDIEKEHPEDCQRVLVWDEYWLHCRILTYNDFYKCWDDESGDDFEFGLDEVLAEQPDKLRVRYWQSLPERPKN